MPVQIQIILELTQFMGVRVRVSTGKMTIYESKSNRSGEMLEGSVGLGRPGLGDGDFMISRSFCEALRNLELHENYS